MSFESRYLPPDPTVWQGRTDIPADSSFFQHMQMLNLLTQKPAREARTAFALLGFKCDEGVQRDLGRTGAFEGPIAIRQRIAKLPLHRKDITLYDAGNIVCIDHDLEASQRALGDVIAMLLKQHIHPIVMGGGHEVSYGHYLGLAEVIPSEKTLGIVNFDAHFDMQPMQPTHRASATTTFYQIAEAHRKANRRFQFNCIGIQEAGNISQLFDIAKESGVNYLLAEAFHLSHQHKCTDFVNHLIDENDHLYLSLSLDVFSPAFAPGVSTIQPLGLSPWQLIPLIRHLAASGKALSYDIAEHVPRYDIDHRTAKLAAMLIFEIIHHHA